MRLCPGSMSTPWHVLTACLVEACAFPVALTQFLGPGPPAREMPDELVRVLFDLGSQITAQTGLSRVANSLAHVTQVGAARSGVTCQRAASSSASASVYISGSQPPD